MTLTHLSPLRWRAVCAALAVGAVVMAWNVSGASAATPLDQAAVPSMCGHPAGRLVDGSLPGIPEMNGAVTIKKGTIRTGVLKGRPGKVRAVVGWCYRGGVSWPEWLLVYTATSPPKRLAAVNMYLVTRGGREGIRGLRFVGGRLIVDVVSIGQKDDAACCGTADARISFTWKGRLRLASKTAYSEMATARNLVAALNSRNRKIAQRYAASDVVNYLAGYQGTSRARLAGCTGALSDDWVWDWSNEDRFTNSQRACTIRFNRPVGPDIEISDRAIVGFRRTGFGTWKADEALLFFEGGATTKVPA